MKNPLFLDIETVPIYRTWVELPENLKNEWKKKCGSRFEKYDTIDLHYSNNVSFFFPFTKIVCISVCRLDSDKTFSYIGDETDILSRFSKNFTSGNFDWFIGHNIIAFDLPFINFRAMVNTVKMPKLIKFFISDNAKAWEMPATDTMKLFKGTSLEQYGLSVLCETFGIPSPKDEMQGNMVCDAYYNGNINRIAKYCEKDVLSTKKIYLKHLNYMNDNI